MCCHWVPIFIYFQPSYSRYIHSFTHVQPICQLTSAETSPKGTRLHGTSRKDHAPFLAPHPAVASTPQELDEVDETTKFWWPNNHDISPTNNYSWCHQDIFIQSYLTRVNIVNHQDHVVIIHILYKSPYFAALSSRMAWKPEQTAGHWPLPSAAEWATDPVSGAHQGVGQTTGRLLIHV